MPRKEDASSCQLQYSEPHWPRRLPLSSVCSRTHQVTANWAWYEDSTCNISVTEMSQLAKIGEFFFQPINILTLIYFYSNAKHSSYSSRSLFNAASNWRHSRALWNYRESVGINCDPSNWMVNHEISANEFQFSDARLQPSSDFYLSSATNQFSPKLGQHCSWVGGGII